MKTINRSERSAMLYTQINGRIFTQEEREGTYTPFDKECKTPFLDAFEKHSDTEPYVVCLAHAIVDSWLCTEPVIHDGEIIDIVDPTTVTKEDIGLMMVGDHINKGEEKAV